MAACAARLRAAAGEAQGARVLLCADMGVPSDDAVLLARPGRILTMPTCCGTGGPDQLRRSPSVRASRRSLPEHTLAARASGDRDDRARAGGATAAEVIAVARHGARAELGDDAREAMERTAAVVARLADSDEPAYGVSTGFGSLAQTSIPAERRTELQRSLIRSHAAGMGPPVEREVVRAMMLPARALAGDRSLRGPAAARRDDAGDARTPGLDPVVPSTARSAPAAISRRSPIARWR